MEKEIFLIYKYAFDNDILKNFNFDNLGNTVLTTEQTFEHMVIRGQIAVVVTAEEHKPVWRMIAEKLITGRRAAMRQDYPLDMFTTLEDVTVIFNTFPNVAREAFRQIENGYKEFNELPTE